MSQATIEARGAMSPLASLSQKLPAITLRLTGLAIVDAVAVWLLLLLVRDQVWPLAAAVVLVTLLVNIINLTDRLYPMRWMSPAFAVILLMVLYPILFTVYTAFTNYSDGHLLTKAQAIQRIGQDQFLPEGAASYQWTGYRSEAGRIALWLVSEDGTSYLAYPNQPLREAVPGEPGIGEADEQGVPASLEGYARLTIRDILPILDAELAPLEFGEPPLTVTIKSISEAAELQPRYVYNPETDTMLDQQSGRLYRADEQRGNFVSSDGGLLSPGYQVTVGLANFQRLLDSPALRGPFLRVFSWTLVFAFLSVLTTFALGLFVAILLNSPILPARKLLRTFLILPYAIPGVIGILIWRGLLNQHLGIVSTTMADLLGWAPAWFTDPTWAKIGILLVNLWLGAPYMMLICSGALQAIPDDIYEAADVDGAGAWRKFWDITLPLLLVSVGPLLIASFTFNFNNFTVIYAYNEGRPPIPGTPTPAGHTDILITYTFRLAFEGGRGADYAYAGAITIVIFLIVASITLLNYGFLGRWEEVSENV